MPTYTFKCPKCQHEFSGLFSMTQSDGKGVVCPKCKSEELKRVYKGAFFIGKNSKSASACPTCSTCSSGTCGLD